MIATLRRFLADEAGPTAVEYAVLLSLILLGAVAGVKAFGDGSSSLFTSDVSKLSTAIDSAGAH